MIKKQYVFIALVFFILLFVTLFFSYSATLRYELKTSAFDGISFTQLLYNITSGRGMLSSIAPPYLEQNWFGIHFSPILYAIAPVYYFFPSVNTLLFIHSFFIALAAVPIFFIARKLLASDLQALLISSFYLINPFIVNAAVWDFHEIAFAPFTLSMMMWAALNQKKIVLVIFSIILLSIKEHYGLAVFGTGLLWAHHHRSDKKFGFFLAAFGIISFIVVIKILMPYFSLRGVASMLDPESRIDRFSWLLRPFERPDLLLNLLSDNFLYAIFLFVPFWFQQIFSLAWLLPGLADMSVNSLSTNSMMRNISSYHSATLIPVLLIAYSKAISSKYTVTTKITRREILFVTAVMTGFVSYSSVSLPIFPNNIWQFSTPKFSLSAEDGIARDEIASIIGGSPISVQKNLMSHIPVRRFMYVFPERTDDAEYVILSTKYPFSQGAIIFGIPYNAGHERELYFSTAFSLLKDKNQGVVFYKNNWLVLKRGATGNEDLRAQAEQDFFNLQKFLDNPEKSVSGGG